MGLYVWVKDASLHIPREHLEVLYNVVMKTNKTSRVFKYEDDESVAEAIEGDRYRIPALLEHGSCDYMTVRYDIKINTGHSQKAYDIISKDDRSLKSNGCMAALLCHGGVTFKSGSIGITIDSFDIDNLNEKFFDFLEAIGPYVDKGGYINMESEEDDTFNVQFDGTRMIRNDSSS